MDTRYKVVWFSFIHIAYRFPPSRPESTNVYSDLSTRWQSIVAATEAMTAHWNSRYSWDSAIVAMIHDGISQTTSALTALMQLLFRLTMCFAYNYIDSTECCWNISNVSLLMVMFCALSFLWMDWHFRASKTFFEPFRIKRWSLYKVWVGLHGWYISG